MINVNGVSAMRKRIKDVKYAFYTEVDAALYQETQVEKTEVIRRTPVDKGALRGSIHVVGPIHVGFNKVYTLIVAGGPSAPYAIYVHENLLAIHPVGQAKFIESVIMESRPYIGQRVANRVQFNRLKV